MYRYSLRLIVLSTLFGVGCAAPTHAGRGAGLGAAGGAITGAIIGKQLGNTGGGAAVGAIAGGLTGAAVGNAMDEVEMRNRAEIEARLGRPVPAGGTTVADIIAMTQAGVNEDVIATHISRNGMAQVVQSTDLIQMQQSGVSPRVMQAAQSPPAVAPPPPIVQPSAVVVPGPYYYGPVPCGPCVRPYYRRHRPRFGWSFGVYH